PNGRTSTRGPGTSTTDSMPSDATDLFLDVAASIGAGLCRDALWAGDRCNWLGDAMEFTGHAWSVVPRAGGPHLYRGTRGIPMFLAQLQPVSGERLYGDTAEGGLRQARSRMDDVSPEARIGLYAGATGIAYVMITAGELLGHETIVSAGLNMMNELVG